MSRVQSRRRVGASLMLIGSLLCAGAQFLPWARLASVPGESPSPQYIVPGLGFFQQLFAIVRYPRTFFPGGVEDLLFWAFIAWGAPIALIARALAIVRERPRARGVGALLLAVVVVLVGAGITIVDASLWVTFSFDVAGPRMLEYGPYVALGGYLCALVGALFLPVDPRRRSGLGEATSLPPWAAD